MRQFRNIAVNAFMELIRQPIFLLLMTGSVLFEIFLAVPYYFAFGDEMKLVKTSALAVMLLTGLFGAVLSASASLAREIRSGTALAVLSKPVGRAQFLLAKFAGLAAALALLAYVNMVGVMLASWMAFDAYGSTNLLAIGIFGGGILLAYALAGFSNFFLRPHWMFDVPDFGFPSSIIRQLWAWRNSFVRALACFSLNENQVFPLHFVAQAD